VVLPADQQLDTRAQAMPLALSPDGRLLLYAARSAGRVQLYLRSLDAFETKPIAGTEGARYPFFSPDGQWVAFFADGKLKRVSVQGGYPVTVCDTPGVGRGGTWGGDGTIVFDPGASGLMSVAADGGIPTPITSQDTEMDANDLSWPQFLPGGRALVATVGHQENAALVMLSLDTGTWSRLGQGFQAQYVPSGHLVFHAPGVREGELQAVSFDLERAAIQGAPVSVLDGVFRAEDGGGAYYGVSANGTLVFAPGGHARTLVRVDRNGRRTPLLDDRRGFRMPSISPDGRLVAVTIDPRPSQIWIYDLGRRSGQPIATEGHNIVPLWTLDGRRVVYAAEDMYWRMADGSSQAERLLMRDHWEFPGSWTKDGRTLVYAGYDPESGNDIWALPPNGDPLPLLTTRANELSPKLSPDARWLAYMSDESGRFEVYVRPFPNVDDGKWVLSTDGGEFPVWSPTSRELFYMNGTTMMSVPVQLQGTFSADTPQPLFTGPFETGSTQFDIFPAGSHFVMVEADPDARPTHINVVVNWAEELKGLTVSSR
jgi:serine/threonine-protein kinase